VRNNKSIAARPGNWSQIRSMKNTGLNLSRLPTSRHSMAVVNRCDWYSTNRRTIFDIPRGRRYDVGAARRSSSRRWWRWRAPSVHLGDLRLLKGCCYGQHRRSSGRRGCSQGKPGWRSSRRRGYSQGQPGWRSSRCRGCSQGQPGGR
jgi:hypothetical protein